MRGAPRRQDRAGRRLPGVELIHDLKTWPEQFEAVLTGAKTHEVRRADRPFAVGDVLKLNEWKPADTAACDWKATGLAGTYTGRWIECEVTHITQGAFGLPADLCVMSIPHSGRFSL